MQGDLSCFGNLSCPHAAPSLPGLKAWSFWVVQTGLQCNITTADYKSGRNIEYDASIPGCGSNRLSQPQLTFHFSRLFTYCDHLRRLQEGRKPDHHGLHNLKRFQCQERRIRSMLTSLPSIFRLSHLVLNVPTTIQLRK
jgi:hypothetical protein